MPTYQYACTECGHQLEAVQSFSDPTLVECPQCQGRLRKVFSAVGVVFKGSGFYRTDSRSGNGSTAGGKSTTKSESKNDGGSTGSGEKSSSGDKSGSGSGSSSTGKSSSGSGSSSGSSKAASTSS